MGIDCLPYVRGCGRGRAFLVVLARGKLVVMRERTAPNKNPYTVCPKYWEGCFECKYYLGFGYQYFCRAYNLKKFGAEIVEKVVEISPEEEERLVRRWMQERQKSQVKRRSSRR